LATLAASNASYTGQVFSFDATITNHIGQALGTTDGVTPSPDGIRAFFASAPVVVSGSGTVDFVDPATSGSLVDGFATITAANQAFYRYSGILAPSATSGVKRWRIHVPSTVTSFTFSVEINAAVANPNGWIDLSPATMRLHAGQTSTFSAIVRDIVGAAVSGAAVTWTSSAASVATVGSASGTVVALGDGSATITASSTSGTATRSGTATVTVVSPSASQSTMLAAPTTLTPGGSSTIVVQAKTAAGTNITVGGDAVVLSVDGGTLGPVTDRGDGSYTASLTSASPRTVHVTGSIDGAAMSQTATVTFVGSLPSVITKAAGDAQTTPVSTSVPTPLSVRITDDRGGPVAGASVSFSVASGGGSIAGGAQTTDASGIATAGAWTLGSTSGANSVIARSGALSTTFTATATDSSLNVIQKTAGDAQTTTVGTAVSTAPAVRIVTTAGAPVAGVTVTFVASNGGAVTNAVQTTNSDGVATIGGWTLSTVAGPNVLTVTAGPLSTTFSAFGAAGVAANIVKVAGDGQSAPVNTTVATSPSVRVTDANGNPVANVSMTFTVTGGGGSVTGATQTTNGSGVATVGAWTLGASSGTNTLSASTSSLLATFSATATPASAGSMSKSAGDLLTAAAGTAVTPAPSVRVVDSTGAPSVGATVTFAVASGEGSVTGASQTTNASGIATVGSWTLGRATGANSLVATSRSLSVTFTATAIAGPPATMTKLAGDGQTATVGTSVANAPSVTVTDANGNAVSGVAVTFAIASGGGSIAGSTQTTDANGIATAGSWMLGATAGANTLTATAGSLSATFSATGAPVAAGRMVVVAGDGQAATVSSAVAVAPSVRIDDASGHPVPGVTVTFTANNGGSVTGPTQVTNASGVASAGSWTLGSGAGTQTLSAVAGALTATFTATATVATGGSGGGSTNLAKNFGDNGTAVVGTAVSPSPSVRVTDAAGNPVSGVTVVFGVRSGGGSVTGGSSVTNASGVASVGTWTLGPIAGSNTLVASLGSASVTFTATGTPGAVHHFVVEAAAGGPIPAQTAGIPFAIKVTAQDVNNNIATSYTGTADISSTQTGSVGLVQSAAFVAGVLASHSVTLIQPGPAATITATNHGGTEHGTSAAFIVSPGAADHFLVEAASGGALGAQTAGVAFNVKITAQDASNNTALGFTGTVDLSSNHATSATGLGTTAAFVNGVLASTPVTLTQASAGVTITATTTGATSAGTSAAFTLNPAAFAKFAVEKAGGGAIAAQTSGTAFGIRVTAQDAFGNTTPTFSGTATLTSNAGGTAPVGLGTVSGFASGVVDNHNVTLNGANAAATITATKTGSTETGTSAAFVLNPGAVHQFKVEAVGGGNVGAQNAGSAFTIQITAQDVNSNTATSFTGTVNVTATNGGTITTTTPTPAFVAGVLASQSVTFTNVGSFALTATNTAPSAETGSSNTITVSPGALHHFKVEASGGGNIGTQTAGTPFTIKLTAQDLNNNTVTGFTGTADLSSTAAPGGLPASAAFVAGVLASQSVTLTQASATPTATIVATRHGGTETGTSNGFVVNAGVLAKFAVEKAGGGVIPSEVSGTAFNIRITAQDANGNTVTSFTGNVDITSNAGGTSPLGLSTNLGGFTSGVLDNHSVTLNGTNAAATITATKTGSAETGTSTAFVLNPGALTHFRVELATGGTIGTQTAGTPFNVKITALDANGNTQTGFTGTVNITATNGGTITTTTPSAAFSAGVLASQAVTFTNVGSFGLTATNTAPSAETGSAAAFTVNPGTVNHYKVEAAPSGNIGGQTAGVAFNVKITALDANGNTATSFTGTVDLSSTGAPGGLPTTTAFTAGVFASQAVTLTFATTSTTIVATTHGGSETGASNSFAVSAGPLAQFAVGIPPAAGTIPTQTAGTSFDLRIVAQDQFGNTDPTYTSTVALSATGATFSGSTTTAAFTAGVLATQAVTITNTGSFQITATGGGKTGSSNTFTVSPGALASFRVESNATGNIPGQTAGTAFLIKVTALDANGNTKTDFGSTVSLSSNAAGTGAVGLGTTSAFSSGVLSGLSVTLNLANASATIVADNGSGITGTSNTFVVSPGALASFKVEKDGGGTIPTQTAGTAFSIQVTALDAHSNVVTGFSGTVSLATSVADGAATGLGGPTAAFTSGVLTGRSVTLTVASAAQTITATHTGGSETGASNAFVVSPGALAKFAIDTAGGGTIGTLQQGTPFAVRIRAQDQFSNLQTSFSGTVDITSTGTLSSGGGTTTSSFSGGLLNNYSLTYGANGSFTLTATKTGSTEAGSTSVTVLAPLAVTATTPANSTTGIDPSANLTVTFNRTVTATTSSFSIACPSGTPQTFSVSGSPGTTITLTPTGGLAAGQNCVWTIVAAQITDNSHFHLGADVTVNFATELSLNADTYTPHVIGNVSVNTANASTPFSVTSNDVIGAGDNITAYGSSGTLNDHVSAHGGTIVMQTTGTTRGQFTYDPPAGFHGSDTFTYTVTTSANVTGTATVTLTVDTPVWFVNNNAGACSSSCDGRLSHPFQSLDNFATVNDGGTNHPAAGQVIFLYESSTDYTPTLGTFTLLDNQVLVGQDASSTLATIYGTTPPAGSTAFPTMNSANATVTQIVGGVRLTSTKSGTIRGLTIAGTATANPLSNNSFGTLTFADGSTAAADVTITQTNGTAIDLTGGAVSGALLSVSGSGGTNAIKLNTITGTLNMQGGSLGGTSPLVFTSGTAAVTYAGSITTTGAGAAVQYDSHTGGSLTVSGAVSCTSSCTGITASSNSAGTLTLSGANTLTTSTNDAIKLATNSGTFAFASSGGLAITTTTGLGVNATGGGTLTATGTNTISATGSAMTLSGVTIGSSGLNFSSVSSSGGTNNLSFTNVASTGGGTVAISGGTLSGASGSSVAVDQGAAAISIASDITKTSAGLITSVTNRSGNTTFSGTLSCSSSCTGIAVGGNSAGTTAYSGAQTVTAVKIGSNSGATVDFSGTGLTVNGTFADTVAGTIAVHGTTNTINAGAAAAMVLSGVTVGSSGVSFGTVNSSGGKNLRFVNVANTSGSTVSIAGGALSGSSATDSAVVINQGTAPISIGATVSKSTTGLVAFVGNRSANATLSGALTCSSSCTGVKVNGNTGGTTTFSGGGSSITAGGSNPAIELTSNTGATIAFSGGTLALSSGTNKGLDAESGGTVTVTGSGNTVTSSSGTAVYISSTDIGSSGVSFQSVNVTSTATNGIFLSSTGTAAGNGSFAVTGNTTSPQTCTQSVPTCDGGHINGTNGSDGTTDGIGVYLSSTKSPSFTRMHIDGTHQNFGLFGTSVSGITLDNVVMDGTYGTNAADDEGTVSLLNLAGTGTVTSGYYANGKENNVRVQTNSGLVTLNGLTFSGTTFGVTQTGADAGLYIQSDLGTSTVTVNNSSSFLGGHTNNVDVRANGSGTLTFSLQNSSFLNNQTSGSATFSNINLAAGADGSDATGSLTYTISGNTLTGSKASAINLEKDLGSITINGTISGNTIGSAGTNDGSSLGAGILVQHAAGGSHSVKIDGNDISHYTSDGITALFAAPSNGATAGNTGTMTFTITRNTIHAPNTVNINVEGIRLDPNNANATHSMCVNFGHTTGGANVLTGSARGSGASFDFGPSGTGAGGTFKMLGLTDLTNTGIQNLGNADNGVLDGFADMQSVTIASGSGCTFP